MITVPAFSGYFTTAKPEPMALLRLLIGGTHKVEATMPEKDARDLASECRKRGVAAQVEVQG